MYMSEVFGCIGEFLAKPAGRAPFTMELYLCAACPKNLVGEVIKEAVEP